MHTNRQLDTYVLEYATKPWFWLLGSFIIAFCAANFVGSTRYRRANQKKQSRPLDSKKETGNASSSPSDKAQQQKFTAWLSEHLTTRLRMRLAVVIYLAVLGAQLLEGYWVAITLTRWTVKLVSRWPRSPQTVAYWAYFLPTGLMLLADFAAVAVGTVVVMFELLWISELYSSGVTVPGLNRR